MRLHEANMNTKLHENETHTKKKKEITREPNPIFYTLNYNVNILSNEVSESFYQFSSVVLGAFEVLLMYSIEFICSGIILH